MTVARGFGIITASGIGFGIGGGLVGLTMGRIAPAYYRGVFGGAGPDLDPVQVGLGLGLTQGLIAGLVVGSVVVMAVALSNLRRRDKDPMDLLS